MMYQRVTRKNPTVSRAIPIYLFPSEKKRKHPGVQLIPWDLVRLERGADRSGGPTACWPWKGAVGANGYGRMKVGGKLLSPHRVAWVFENGDLVPDRTYHGGMIMHSCDNPRCCNPAHLILGSAMQNAQDMARKGRAYPQSEAFRSRKAPSPFTPFCGRS